MAVEDLVVEDAQTPGGLVVKGIDELTDEEISVITNQLINVVIGITEIDATAPEKAREGNFYEKFKQNFYFFRDLVDPLQTTKLAERYGTLFATVSPGEKTVYVSFEKAIKKLTGKKAPDIRDEAKDTITEYISELQQAEYLKSKGFVVHQEGDGTEISFPCIDLAVLGAVGENGYIAFEYKTSNESVIGSMSFPEPVMEGYSTETLVGVIEGIVASEGHREKFNDSKPIHILVRDPAWQPVVDMLLDKYMPDQKPDSPGTDYLDELEHNAS